jgi:serine/threonine protein kinase/Tfp pilus assembly protein PilF
MAQAIIPDLPGMGSSPSATSAPRSTPAWALGLEDAACSYQALRGRLSPVAAEDLDRWCAAFPGNPAHAQLFRDLHRHDPTAADRLAGALTAMPGVGANVAGFRLLTELGRGTFGRVFLARQGDLANRPVVLKIVAGIGAEAQTLARLRHPHIVPVYSVHRCPPFQAVCMPYLGLSTLEDVLSMLQDQPTLPAGGQALVSTRHFCPPPTATSAEPRLAHSETVNIRGKHAVTPPAPPPSLPRETALPEMPVPAATSALQTLQRLSYVEAVLWIAARLADGLAHAHEQGVIHRDLKPANILLTDDGQPMLLDFNVAKDSELGENVSAARLGGTLPYMAPEQLAVFEGANPIADPRSDLYALGVILYELLTGRYPFPLHDGSTAALAERMRQDRLVPPSLHQGNPQVTPAVEAIVRRCLEPDPAHRYQKAAELREDLDRQLVHLPLRHTPEPSLRERANKWIRRHPRLAAAAGVGMLAALLLLGLGTWLVQRGQRLAQIEQRQDALAGLAQFDEDRKTAQFRLYTRLSEPEQRDAGMACCARALARYQVPDNPDWENLPAVRALPDEEQQRLREAVCELLLLQTRAVLVRHGDHPDNERLREALQLNGHAEELDASGALFAQRADLLHLLGEEEEARAARARAEALPPHTARDHYWLASEHLAHGRTQEALPLLQQATRLEPANFWAWFVLGNCYDRQGEDVRAEACYATCITLAPDSHWAYFNRGLAFLRQKDYAQACADFDEVLRRRPEVTEALIDRALAREGLRRVADAVQDLTEALERGAPETRIYFVRSRLRSKLGDAEGARRDKEEGLRREPADEKSWVTRGFARLADNPQGALADFEQALRINPRSAAALQNKAHVLAEKLGRTEEAVTVLTRALELYPGAAASRSGRGVLRARLGRRDEAIKDGEDALLQDATPPRQYQVACIYALTSKQQPDDRLRALQLLASALARGYGADLLPTDSDLDPLRDLPEFRRLAAPTRKP